MLAPFVLGPLVIGLALAPVHVREVRANGITVRASARECGGAVEGARLEIRARGVTQTIDLGARDTSAALLLRSIELTDATFDGYADLLIAHDVFIFDPAAHRFSNDSPLAHELSHLSNVSFDAAHKTISTRDMGPANPSRITYAIEGARLRELSACHFYNASDPRVGTLVRTRAAHSTFAYVRLGAAEADPCAP